MPDCRVYCLEQQLDKAYLPRNQGLPDLSSAAAFFRLQLLLVKA